MARGIHNSLSLRLAGWRAAARSPKTPKHLRAAIRANALELARQLRMKKKKKGRP
jgi:hypothetical protein